MAIYLVQHGTSVPEEVDPRRPLSPEGRKEVEGVASWAQRAGLRVQQIVHSDKERARQTAELLAAALRPPEGVAQRPGLAPLDDADPWVAWLDQNDGTMVVGHLPFLARLASLMIVGAPEPTVVEFRQGGIVCLARREGGTGWAVNWAVWPNLLL